MGRVGSLDILRSEIIKQAKEQSVVILDRARRVSERDLEFAKEEAEELKNQQRAKLQPIIDMEKKKIIASAEMEERRMLLEKKEELVSRLFADVESRIEEMRGSKFYTDMLAKSIENGVSVISADSVIEFCEKDKEIFSPEFISLLKSNIAKSLKLNVKLRFQNVGNTISGGVVVRTEDGKVSVDNSFSSLIRRLKEEFRGKVSEILLEDQTA